MVAGAGGIVCRVRPWLGAMVRGHGTDMVRGHGTWAVEMFELKSASIVKLSHICFKFV